MALTDLVQLATFFSGTALAAFVYLTRPERTQNQLLALFLLLEGLHIGFGGLGGVLGSPRDLWAAGVAQLATAFLGLYVYLLFLGTIPGRFSAVLRPRWVQGSLAGVATVATLGVLMRPEVAFTYWPLVQVIGAAVFLYGLLVAWGFYEGTEPGSATRRKARAYVAAFGIRDAVVAPALFVFATVSSPAVLSAFSWAFVVVIPVFHMLLAYGALRTQLFDIELKVKFALKQSTVAAVFVAVFFAASEGAQVLFAGFAGNELVGVGAAALLVFALAPLQRIAQRISDAAMPGVEDTVAYREARKEEVFRAQLEELLADGQVTAKERRALLRLQESLRLDGDTASRLEREVLDVLPAPC